MVYREKFHCHFHGSFYCFHHFSHLSSSSLTILIISIVHLLALLFFSHFMLVIFSCAQVPLAIICLQ